MVIFCLSSIICIVYFPTYFKQVKKWNVCIIQNFSPCAIGGFWKKAVCNQFQTNTLGRFDWEKFRITGNLFVLCFV